MSNDKITLEDLYVAYRKAKVDLFYSSNPPLSSLANYEDKLSSNLEALLAKINGSDESWVCDENFIGGWTVAPKSINLDKKSEVSSFIFSSPLQKWNLNDREKQIDAEFRLMAKCSLDFHVFSTLWMLKVGADFDQKLTENAYGSRLRRDKNGSADNNLIGSFKPYMKPFREWRDGAFRRMHTELEKDEKAELVSLTADVTSFYHELNPDFMLDESFLEKHGLGDFVKNKLHLLFISALGFWAKNTPLKKGLPVGLPASAIIANMALMELDEIIESNIRPLYYGRYVDDILLVMKRTSDVDSPLSFWEKVFQCSEGLLGWFDKKKNSVEFKANYLRLSNPSDERCEGKILFQNNKIVFEIIAKFTKVRRIYFG